jgi:predicted transcriptional regulator YdeE
MLASVIGPSPQIAERDIYPQSDYPHNDPRSMSMETINQASPIPVVGIELRTNNEAAFQEIPKHWQRFVQEGVLGKITGKVSNDIYAVYTNFENKGKNNDGTYSFIIGAEVKELTNVPPAFASTTIPASRRQVFKVAAGHPEQVGAKWQEIWGLKGLNKTFVSDYEHYRESGEIEILVGVK